VNGEREESPTTMMSTKEKKIEQPKMRKSLSALVALSLVVLASSLSTSFASSDGPSVDPDLPWITPQEFKVKSESFCLSPRFCRRSIRHRRRHKPCFSLVLSIFCSLRVHGSMRNGTQLVSNIGIR